MKRRKILWITFWTTVTFWLGGAWGQPIDTPASAEPQAVAAVTPPVMSPVMSPVMPTLDRSHWPMVEVAPAPQGTGDFPVYYLDCPIVKDDPAPAPAQVGETEEDDLNRLEASLTQEKSAHCTVENWTDAWVQPVKMVFDTLVLPVRLVLFCGQWE